ncbi:MAG: eukaryotic-like serine/threonine-protein kinase [Verrucomicrobiota bacterium]|jgi:TolB-like protein/Tfp pilus assembly protein PilF
MNLGNFFAEVRRRNVYKVAVAYGIVSWLVIQIATQTFPFFEIPSWAVRLVIVSLLLGFPIALVFAWVFELTPEGLKRTEDVPVEKSVVRQTGRKLDALIIVVLLAVIGFLVFRRVHQNAAPSERIEKSIAVLLFDNFSDDKENAFFADGIQDDILTSLAKIRDLKVVSRTSVMPYRGASRSNLRQIAEALGVANILEGSVRRGGNRVVVSVQLIDARNDRNIWANRYDRPLADSLGLQGELAAEIASELRATLSPEEKVRVETKPTENPDAYVLYLRARTFESNADRLFEDYRAAEQLYTEAIQHDPSFALAHARLSATVARIYTWFDSTEQRRSRMKTEAEKALQLRPDLGEGHLALGLYYYYGEKNYDKALEEFAVAARALPNDSDVGYFAAAIRRRQGRWNENIELLKNSLTLDPGNANVASEIALTYGFLHQWPEATRLQERVTALAPDSINSKIFLGYYGFWSDGSTTALRDLLQKIPSGVDPGGIVTRARWDLAMIQRDYDAADQVLTACPLDQFQANGQPTPKSFYRGCVALARGDQANARKNFDLALPAFGEAVRLAPVSAIRHANLGLLCSFLGRKEEAIAEGQRAVELEPEARDAVSGPWMAGFLAMIYVRVGELDSALPLLGHLLTSPGPIDNTNCCITYSDLRSRWQWDPVRSDPRFQKILEGPEPKTR